MMVAEVQTWTSAKAAGSCKHGVISPAPSLQILNKLIRVKWSRKKKSLIFFFYRQVDVIKTHHAFILLKT